MVVSGGFVGGRAKVIKAPNLVVSKSGGPNLLVRNFLSFLFLEFFFKYF